MTNFKSLSRRSAVHAALAAGAAMASGAAASAAAASAPSSSKPAAPDPDPEFTAVKARMLDASKRGSSLTPLQKHIAILAAAATASSPASVASAAAAALKDGVFPVQVKEAIYQCTPYVGIARIENVLPALNAALEAAGVRLPLDPQGTVTDADRFEKGLGV